jgi:biopolymer transport protein ExbB/TolQ
MNLIAFIQNNLLHIAPILIAAVFAGTVMVERFKTLYRSYRMQNIDGFFEKIRELVSDGRMKEAAALCAQFRGKPAADLINEALMRAHQPEELIMNTIELARNRYAEKIQKRTSYLATIANVATLLGLLGTIAGLIESFGAVGHADAQQKAALLANGISTAMNATLLGLGLAVPCMVVFSFFVNQSNRLIAELESAGILILDSILVSSLKDASRGALA